MIAAIRQQLIRLQDSFVGRGVLALKRLFPTQRRPWLYGGVFVFLLVIGLFALVAPASAESAASSLVSGLLELITRALLALARLCIGLAIFALRFFIELAAYNDFVNTPTVVVGWLLVRDVANMFFVVVLLVIAFGTILGIEQYEWKKTMAHFVIAAIFVNFSKLIAGLIIDVAHVFTTTFLNAVSGAAGGNLITMFHFDVMFNFVTGTNLQSGAGDLTIELWIASLMAFIFAFMAMWTMFAYLLIMLIRIVVLWALIIMSPIAFIMGVLPATKKYSQEWWSEFTNHVIVAPVMVFFLWLAFATLGSGDFVATDLGVSVSGEEANAALGGSGENKVSIGQVSTWGNMANFMVAIAFLWIGLDRTQKTGAKGAGFTNSVTNFTKKAALIASGYIAGRAIYEGGVDFAGKGVKKGLAVMPLGGNFWKRQGRAIRDRAKFIKGKSDERRVTRAAQRDKKGLFGTGTGFDKFVGKWVYNRGLGTLTGGLVGDTTGRADKRAKDWEEVAERQKKIVEESYSTSSTSAAGRAKTQVTGRLKIVEELAEQKKNKKVEEEVLRQLGRLEGAPVPTDWASQQTRNRADVTAIARADRRELRKAKEVDDAEREAAVLRGRGKTALAQSVIKTAYKKQFKEDSEEFENMEYNERIGQSDLIADRLRTATGNQAKNLRKDAMRLLVLAGESSEEEFSEMLETMVTRVYGGVHQEMTNENMGQRILEAITGSQISNQTEFEDAHRLLNGGNTFRDSNESQAVLSKLSSALKKQAKESGLRGVGAVVEGRGRNKMAHHADPGIDSAAPVGYRIMGFGPRHADQASKRGLEQYMQTRTNFKTQRNLRGYMNVQVQRHAPSGEDREHVTGLSPDQQDHLVEALSQFGDEREVNSGFSSTSARGNDRSEFTADAQRDMEAVLRRVQARYAAAGLPHVFSQLMRTQFSDWRGAGGGPAGGGPGPGAGGGPAGGGPAGGGPGPAGGGPGPGP